MKYLLTILLILCPHLYLRGDISEEEAQEIAIQAYIYGYPLVMMEMTRKVMTNVPGPVKMQAPMGMFAHETAFPTASSRDVTKANLDTLTSLAWLDLSKEPYIFEVPQEGNRYYVFSFLDAWTEVFASVGTRTTGTAAQDFAITGPNWEGLLPSGVAELKSPTNLVWILGKTYCKGTQEDYSAVQALQKRYFLTRLSQLGHEYYPSNALVDSTIDEETSIRDQVNQMSGLEFFRILIQKMTTNPPSKNDSKIIEKMMRLGIIAGAKVEASPNIIKAIEKAPKMAYELIQVYAKSAGKQVNGWNIDRKTGSYETNYLHRAFIASRDLGAPLPEDIFHTNTHVDSAGDQLHGKHHYALHFPRDKIPPVNGLWSLTMYDEQYYLVPNPLGRYSLNSRNGLKYNQDGSLDLYIQNKSPGPDKESNWLAAPQGNFILMLRLYWPTPSLFDNSWQPPGVSRIKTGIFFEP